VETAGSAGRRGILLDIEGTTTPLAFVTDVLFPYARANVREFLERRGRDPHVQSDVALLRTEHEADVRARAAAAPPPWQDDVESAVAYVHALMDQDRKSTALKALQGRIWEEGFRSGALRGEVYPDVPPALERWRRQGSVLAIFSSGSVLAQKLLFGSTGAGDLTSSFDGFFDTTTGPKREPESYRRIATALSLEPSALTFVSDVVEELDAARAARLATVLCVRGAAPADTGGHPVVTTFDELP
jgi:enolase-phosphatase E1